MQKPVSGKDAKETVLAMSDAELSSAIKMLAALAGVDAKTAERLGSDPKGLRGKLSRISEEQIGSLLSAYGNADVSAILESFKNKNTEK